MVLFSKSAATKAFLLSQRAFSTTKSNAFNYLIKELPMPSKKLPHPEHVKSIIISNLKLKFNRMHKLNDGLYFKLSAYGETSSFWLAYRLFSWLI